MPDLSSDASTPWAKAVRSATSPQGPATASHGKGALLGCCTDISLPGRPYDHAEPVIPEEDWEMLSATKKAPYTGA